MLVLSPPNRARLSPLSYRLVSFRSCFRLLLFRSPYPAPPERLRIRVSKRPSAGNEPTRWPFLFGSLFSMENINVD